MAVVTQAQWFPFGYGHGLFGEYHPGFGYAPAPYSGFPPGFPYYGFPIFNPYTLIHSNSLIESAPASSLIVGQPIAPPSLFTASTSVETNMSDEPAPSENPVERVVDELAVSTTPFIDEVTVTDASVTEILATEDPVTDVSGTDVPATDVPVVAPATEISSAATSESPLSILAVNNSSISVDDGTVTEIPTVTSTESPAPTLVVNDLSTPVANDSVNEVFPVPITTPVPAVASTVTINSLLPVPVQDTPEVAAAKREFAILYAAAKAAAEAAPDTPSVTRRK